MKREGDELFWEGGDAEEKAIFEHGIEGGMGCDAFIDRLVKAFQRAGESQHAAWGRVIASATEAGLITAGELLTYIPGTQTFTVLAGHPRAVRTLRAANAALSERIRRLEEEKVCAVEEKRFSDAAKLRDIAEKMRNPSDEPK